MRTKRGMTQKQLDAIIKINDAVEIRDGETPEQAFERAFPIQAIAKLEGETDETAFLRVLRSTRPTVI